jgi:hypothetical protein
MVTNVFKGILVISLNILLKEENNEVFVCFNFSLERKISFKITFIQKKRLFK